MHKPLKIVFMGTPEFAVPVLETLCNNKYEIAAVITAPDKEAGRGLTMKISAVKEYALEHQIRILQPIKLKDPDFLETLKKINADLQIVVAFRMLPEIVWSMPSLGTINLHASLLPDYRGAAPINHAIMQGETETGVTTFFLKQEIDTGDILLSEKILIAPDDDAGTLHEKLSKVGAQLILKSVQLIEQRNYTLQSQKHESKKIAPKIFKENCTIDFNKTCIQVNNFIRSLSPYPTAFTILEKKQLKIFKAHFELETHSFETGKFISDQQKFLKVAVLDGFIFIDNLQWEGKKRMDIKSFLLGYKPKN